MPAQSEKQANLFRAALGDPKPGTGAYKIKHSMSRDKIKHFTHIGEGDVEEGIGSKVNKNPFKVGDKVILKSDALARHSRSVPARMGYTHEQFVWRDILGKIQSDKTIGTVERLFDQSKHMNVDFNGTLIGIDYTELDPAPVETEGTAETLGLTLEQKKNKLKDIIKEIAIEILKGGNKL